MVRCPPPPLPRPPPAPWPWPRSSGARAWCARSGSCWGGEEGAAGCGRGAKGLAWSRCVVCAPWGPACLLASHNPLAAQRTRAGAEHPPGRAPHHGLTRRCGTRPGRSRGGPPGRAPRRGARSPQRPWQTGWPGRPCPCCCLRARGARSTLGWCTRLGAQVQRTGRAASTHALALRCPPARARTRHGSARTSPVQLDLRHEPAELLLLHTA